MKWILKERLNVDRSVDTHNAPVTFWTSSAPNSKFLGSFLQQLKSWSDNQGLAWVWRSEEFMIHQFWSRFCGLANEANWQAGKRAEKKRDWSRVDPILVRTHTVFFVPCIICACKHNTFAQWVPYSFVHIHELCLCVMDLILVPIMCWFCWSGLLQIYRTPYSYMHTYFVRFVDFYNSCKHDLTTHTSGNALWQRSDLIFVKTNLQKNSATADCDGRDKYQLWQIFELNASNKRNSSRSEVQPRSERLFKSPTMICWYKLSRAVFPGYHCQQGLVMTIH